MSSVYHYCEKKKVSKLDSISVLSMADSTNSVNRSSPFGRIFSKANVTAYNLPTFLRSQSAQRGITVDDLRRIEVCSIPHHQSSPIGFSFETLRPKIEQVLLQIRKTYCLKEFSEEENLLLEAQINQIINESNPGFTILIKNRNIPAEELSKLTKEKDISPNIINCFMQHLKQVNKIGHKVKTSKITLNIATEEFSEAVVAKGTLLKQKSISMQLYDCYVFPIFNHY